MHTAGRERPLRLTRHLAWSHRLGRILLIAVPWTGLAAESPAPSAAATNMLPHEWIGNIDRTGFKEPSGICYHSSRRTLFVVGDEGDVCEMKTDGTPVKSRHIRHGDFEGITHDPSTGLLYIAVEGEETILEVHPDSLEVLRTFSIPRQFEGRMLMKEGGQGVEGITFVPDPTHPQGGTFQVANQSFRRDLADDVSAVIEVELPLRSVGKTTSAARILRCIDPGIVDISGLCYDAATDSTLLISDTTDTLLEYDRSGRILGAWRLPGTDQEGIAADPDGFLYIAQDSGGIVKIRRRTERGTPSGKDRPGDGARAADVRSP
jgi:hypothetical protein